MSPSDNKSLTPPGASHSVPGQPTAHGQAEQDDMWYSAIIRARAPRAALERIIQRQGSVAMLILAGITVFMCLSHILHGSFAADDWTYRAQAHFTGFGGIVSQQISQDARRPIAALYFATLFTLLGSHIKLLLICSAILRFLIAASVYALLRKLRFKWLDSVAIAGLVLLFAASDSTWLWATASVISFAVFCVLFGCFLNLHGVCIGVQHRRILRIAGLVLIVLGILTYELVAPLGLASGVLYLTQTQRHRALREWCTDLVVLGAAMIIFTFRLLPVLQGSDVHEVSTLSQMSGHAHVIFSQSATLLTRSLLPFGTPRNATVLGLLGALCVLALAVAFLLGPNSHTRRALLRWLVVITSGFVLIGLGYIFLIPSNIYYVPLQVGIGNRINSVSAIGYALVVYGSVALAVTLVFRELPHSYRWASGLAALIAVGVGLGYSRRIDTDKATWHRAATLASTTLVTLSTHVSTPPHGASVVTLNAPQESAPGVPVFDSSWDLNGAVQLIWGDSSLKAFPAPSGANITCTPAGLFVNTTAPPWQAKYPTDLVNVAAGSVYVVTSWSGCTHAATKLGILAA
jgi:hypothetical protein